MKKRKQEASADTVSIGNAHHVGARDNQQDSFAISDVSNQRLCRDRGVLCVLADGMGGLPSGGAVSNLVTQTMLRRFGEEETKWRTDDLLMKMVMEANDEVVRHMQGYEKGGSTVVAVIVRDGCLYWATVGDSRLCLLRGGAIIQINREHTYGIELDEKAAKNEIPWDEAKNDPQRASLTSYLGLDKIKHIDRNIRPLRLLPQDRIVLMSDGVFNTLSDEEILDVMREDAHESACLLERAVLAKELPYQDNFTAIIMKIL